MKQYFGTSIFILATLPLFAQQTEELKSVAKQLKIIHDRDQNARKGIDSAAYLQYIDSTNLVSVEAIIDKYGWPGRSLVGSLGNETIWLVIQHANLAVQERYLPMMQASVDKNESSATELAYLEDRIRMRKGQKQLYGTQVSRNPQTGKWEIWPIEKEKDVNKRRAELYLQPLENYAKSYGIEYILPEH
jgi:hypothetical protein